MSERKCIYTNEKSKAKDSVIPKKSLKNEAYNWNNSAPCSVEYKNFKKDRMPTEDEFRANEFFQKLELSKLRVRYYEEKLAEIQKKINASFAIAPESLDSKTSKKTAREVELAIHEAKVIQKTDIKINKALSKRKNSKIWE